MQKTSGLKIQIAVVEDDRRVRDALVHLVNQTPGIQCVAQFGDAETAQEELLRKPADVVLMDIHLPKMSGIEALPRLKAKWPHMQIMMLSVDGEPSKIFQALRAGATGYLVKTASQDEIASSIFELYRGGSPMSTQVARRLVQVLHGEAEPVRYKLTPREFEILSRLRKGESDKEIASALDISVWTVRNHNRSIYEKLQVRSRTEAVSLMNCSV